MANTKGSKHPSEKAFLLRVDKHHRIIPYVRPQGGGSGGIGVGLPIPSACVATASPDPAQYGDLVTLSQPEIQTGATNIPTDFGPGTGTVELSVTYVDPTQSSRPVRQVPMAVGPGDWPSNATTIKAKMPSLDEVGVTGISYAILIHEVTGTTCTAQLLNVPVVPPPPLGQPDPHSISLCLVEISFENLDHQSWHDITDDCLLTLCLGLQFNLGDVDFVDSRSVIVPAFPDPPVATIWESGQIDPDEYGPLANMPHRSSLDPLHVVLPAIPGSVIDVRAEGYDDPENFTLASTLPLETNGQSDDCEAAGDKYLSARNRFGIPPTTNTAPFTVHASTRHNDTTFDVSGHVTVKDVLRPDLLDQLIRSGPQGGGIPRPALSLLVSQVAGSNDPVGLLTTEGGGCLDWLKGPAAVSKLFPGSSFFT